MIDKFKGGVMEKIKEFQVLVSCAIICIAILLSSLIFASKIQRNENITVTGSASKIVKSDNAKLQVSITSKAPTQKDSYNLLKAQLPKVLDYLNAKGIEAKNIEVKAISGYYNYRHIPNGGLDMDSPVSYNAEQAIEFKSTDVQKIKEISTDIQNLVANGVSLNVMQPEYYYSDLASIKIDLLKEASIDAKQRAASMLSATGSHVGRVQSMKMGVFQITPADSTNVSDYGYNDTTTIDKKVTAVANIVFKVR